VAADGAIEIDLRVSPKASRNAITGWRGARLKVAVTAAPERGKANAAVIAVLADALGCARSAVDVIRGETSQDKCVRVAAGVVSVEAIAQRLPPFSS
jgi:uncharacterized protein (TIGR00251 family)